VEVGPFTNQKEVHANPSMGEGSRNHVVMDLMRVLLGFIWVRGSFEGI